MIPAADLNQRVTIQALVTAGSSSSAGDDPADAWGDSALPQEWTDVATVWADVRELKAQERTGTGAAAGVQTTVTHRVRIRFREGITTRHRLVYRGTVLDIESIVDPYQRRVELLIDCHEHIDRTTDTGT